MIEATEQMVHLNSILQPGSFPGLPTYDPNNPPAGSIAVTTAFAAGTNMQDVFIDRARITSSITLSASS